MIMFALVTDAYGAGGGIAQYNRDLFAALAATSACERVVVLARHGQLTPEALPAKVQQLGIARGKAAFFWRALVSAWRLPRVDVVFCGHIHMVPLALLLSWMTRSALWLQIHGIEAWQRPAWLVRASVARVQLVTAVSRHTRRLFLQWARCEPWQVRVLPNTVAEVFVSAPPRAELQLRYGTAGKRVLLTVSRLAAAEQYKGHDRVMQAMARLRDTAPALLYLIAGDGDDRPRLEALARQLDLSDRVRFIGYVPDAELPELYCLADVFVMPSSGEGFGIVFLQALMSGTPVIAGDTDGSRDPLRDGAAGQLVPLHDDDALAAALMLQPDTAITAAANVFSRSNFCRHAGALLRCLSSQPLWPDGRGSP